MSPFILFAYRLKTDKLPHPLRGEEVSKALKEKGLAWVHLDASHPDTDKWLRSELNYLDPFILSALTAQETRPRVTQIDDGTIVILRGVNLNTRSETEDMVSTRLFIDKTRIISLQIRPVKAAKIIADNIEASKAPVSSGEFLCQFISQLTVHFETVISDLDDMTDSTEERLLEAEALLLRQEILDIRKKAIVLRRHLAPQREAISQLRMSELSWITDTHKRHLHESFNHLVRYVEELDSIRERAQIIKDELANIIADKLNKNTYVLSVIAAIFLPLGFLTGLLGINVGGVPGVNSPIAFTVFCIILLIIVAFQIVIFRKLKWF